MLFRNFNGKLKNLNYLLLFAIIGLNAMGTVAIMSTSGISSSLSIKQILGSTVSIGLCILISLIDINVILEYDKLIYGIGLAFLIAVKIAGTAYGRVSIRWIELPFIGQFQPTEILKLGLIIFFSKFFATYGPGINSREVLFRFFLWYFVPILFVLMQPNLSTALIITVIVFTMFFVSEIRGRFLVILIASAALFFALVLFLVKGGGAERIPFLQPYQIQRISSFLNPSENTESQYQQDNSVIAIGSGGLEGKGVMTDSIFSVKNGDWLVEERNDFIFAVIGEEVGFRGSIFILAVFLFVIYSCFIIASTTRGIEEKFICVGVGAWIGFQTFTNIGVATSLLPNTGVPLPFFSQGLTSLVSVYLGMGIVLGIDADSKIRKAPY